jgi:hypothetical protein
MPRKSDPLSDSFGTDDADGWLGGIVADEDDLDRQTLWRLGLWGAAAVGALTLGILSGQLPVNAQRTQLAADDFAGRAKQVESKVQESQLEARRLAAAIETLHGDRDRLFSRLSNLEQGLDVITGSIKKTDDKPTATPWPDVAIAPVLESAPATVVTPPSTPSPPVVAAPAIEPASTATTIAARVEPQPTEAAIAKPPSPIEAIPIPDAQPATGETGTKPAEETAVTPSDFAVDLGAANSLSGLRALWRGLQKSHKAQLEGLRPLIAVRERRNGLGLQLRLIAGPIKDAAAVARICAVLSDADRDCATAPFDGQRLSLASEGEERAQPTRPAKQRKSSRLRTPETPQAKPAATSSLSSVLGFR